ncbi:MAG: hypothetical protein A2Y62_04155 [Candidatus Fischerbacteria bacterium RBG_13_37_8]|uniref:Prepilin-type N-terminal cleavage/methylation domain-containing protein n=1 Tax=Candidatus Fischerbacteria bacterium RBG_13_37_8 TaxID=1817863 RepID=A0A1F5V671_9BACT|nr:MAG: hypothetical protein A2Y62_04155 [Candidatus Fischerbacteria bacterium RBG_13_37_8]
MKIMHKKGFSLIEILVVMAILMIVIVGVLGVFYDMMRIRKRTDVLLGMQQNARYAALTLTNKLQMTGYETSLDSAIIPDPRCQDEIGNPVPGFITQYCMNEPNRVQNSDGIVIFENIEDRRFFKPFCVNVDPSCVDSSVMCIPPGPIDTNTVNICSPSGFADDELINQPLMVCGPVQDLGSVGGCDWVIPDPMPQLFLSECVLGSAYLCCAARQIMQGPVCSASCVRDPVTGICGDPASCSETITLTPPNVPVFMNVPVRCLFIPPVQAIHYQIHEDPTSDPAEPRRNLMVRINNAIDPNTGNALWQPVAANVVDLQTCYVFDANCDPAQQCRRWQWTVNGGVPFVCNDTGQPASVRNIRRVMVQVTTRTAEKVIQSARFTENPTCVPGSIAPPLPPKTSADENAVWRQYTLCNEVIARNLAYKELTPPTIW